MTAEYDRYRGRITETQKIKMSSFLARAKKFFGRKSIKYAIPFFTLMIGGTIGLREFSNLRYQYSQKKLLTEEQAQKLGIEMKTPGEVTLETEYQKIKDVDIEGWQNIRITRPWDENETN